MEASENWEDDLIEVPDYPLPTPSVPLQVVVPDPQASEEYCDGGNTAYDTGETADRESRDEEFTIVPSHPRKLYVSNVNFRTSQKALWTFLERFGDVEYCRLLRDRREKSKGRAFVTYKSVDSCENALAAGSDELSLHKRTLNIEKAVWKKYNTRGHVEVQAIPCINKQLLDRQEDTTGDKVKSCDYVEPIKSESPHRKRSTHKKDVNMSSGINALPDDCLLSVFQYLTIVDRLKLQRVCKHWQELLSRSVQSLSHLCFTSVTARFSVVTDRIFSPILKLCGRRLRSLDLSGPKCRAVTYKSYELIGSQCRQLRSLDLSGSLISNRSLQMLSKGTPRLTKVRLENCHDVGEKGLWWLFHQCQKLAYVDVSDNQRVTGQCFHRLTSHLRTLILSNCSMLMGEGLTKLSERCKELEHLELGPCRQLNDDALCDIFWACKKIKVLHLDTVSRLEAAGPTVTEEGTCSVAQLADLEELVIPNNNQYAITDSLIQHIIEGCRFLRKVDISHSEKTVTDATLRVLGEDLPYLTHVTVSYLTQISDAGLMQLAQAPRLQSVVARCTRVTDKGVCHLLSTCELLSTLDVCGCQSVTEASVRRLVSLMELRGSSTDMFHFYVGGTGVETVGSTPACVRVYLRNLHNFSLMPGNEFRRDYLGSDDEEDDELWFEHEYDGVGDDFLDYDDPLFAERFQPS